MGSPVEIRRRAAADQLESYLDDLVRTARSHRRGRCVQSGLGCIGDGLTDYLIDEQQTAAGRNRVLLLLSTALARLADQPEPPTTVEGIST